MRTVADLKRTLKVGQKIQTTWADSDKYTIRSVTHVQSNSFAMNGSWLDYPKAACFEPLGDNKFNVYRAKQITFEGLIQFDDKQRGDLLATYEILN